MKNKILGGLTTQQFLKEYWQKKPLFIPQAFPQFSEILNKKDLIDMASEEMVQSRCVQFVKGEWQLAYGPFKKNYFKKLQEKWTLLVQGVNHHRIKAQALLQLFNFIPYQRLDDLMISFAPDGGGVGPHFDSYDVFLLQGAGKRLWQISNQADHTLLEDVPLRILKNFKSQQEWILEPGDMLYLPPNYAHNGIAEGDCMTYSIGFRAPNYQELLSEFLHYLEDSIDIKGRYEDPDLKVSSHPAQLSATMINRIYDHLKKITFNKKIIADFLGKYLSEPKPDIFFDEPENPISKQQFLKLLNKHGVRLTLQSQMLFTNHQFYLNGESFRVPDTFQSLFKTFADTREIYFSRVLPESLQTFLYNGYLKGYIEIKSLTPI